MPSTLYFFLLDMLDFVEKSSTFASRSDRDHKKKHKTTNEKALGVKKLGGLKEGEKFLRLVGV